MDFIKCKYNIPSVFLSTILSFVLVLTFLSVPSVINKYNLRSKPLLVKINILLKTLKSSRGLP